jgi:hypothetical protein
VPKTSRVTPFGTGHVMDLATPFRAFDQREHEGIGHRRADGRTWRRTPPSAASRSAASVAEQTQVVGESVRRGVVDAHDRTCPIGLAGLPRPVGDRGACRALGRRGDGVLEIQDDRIGTAGERLREPLRAIARTKR